MGSRLRGRLQWIAIGAFLALLAGVAVAAEAPRMTKEELKGLLGDPALVVIDTRLGGDWDSSDAKIPGAVRESPTAVAAWAAKYPKDKTIVLYCA